MELALHYCIHGYLEKRGEREIEKGEREREIEKGEREREIEKREDDMWGLQAGMWGPPPKPP